MTANRRTVAWAQKYRELLAGHIDALGGANVSPTQRALAETLATLQTEMSTLSSRFATGGGGASAEDLGLFLKLTDKVADLLRSIGLSPQSQPTQQGTGESFRVALAQMLNSKIQQRLEEEAKDLFRDAYGNLLTDPDRIAIERQVFTLRHGRPPCSEAVPVVEPIKPEEVTLELTASVLRGDAPVPEKSTTQKFYEWSEQQGSRFP